MKADIKDNIIHIVILDISGIYAQIHNQGYFDKEQIEEIKSQYSDKQRWRVVILDNKSSI